MGVCSSTDQKLFGDRIRPVSLTGKECYRLQYRSVIEPGVDVEDIIAKANVKNKRLNIGGAFWVEKKSRRARQVLEGEYAAVSALLRLIAKDKRHKQFKIEREEFPLSRFYGSWGGMVFADSPDFDAAIEKEERKTLTRARITFQVKASGLEFDNITKKFCKECLEVYGRWKVGGILFFFEDSQEFNVILEGSANAVQGIISSLNLHNSTSAFSLVDSDKIKTRAFTVFSSASISRISSVGNSSFKVNLGGGFECFANSTIQSAGNFFAVVRFRSTGGVRKLRLEEDKHLDADAAELYNGPNLDELIGRMQEQLQIDLNPTKTPSTMSVSEMSERKESPLSPTAKGGRSSVSNSVGRNREEKDQEETGKIRSQVDDIEVSISGLVKLIPTVHEFTTFPLGFRIEAATKEDIEECDDRYNFACIPTTNSEMVSKGICAGSAILKINGKDVRKANIKFLVTEIQKGSKNLPIVVEFGVKMMHHDCHCA
mmetsp:Transcript_6304/g.9693  ORF Transcript_6304/g.9693 Transcript_6304/m.9693 type:complete len:486 (-) Transcript_6304:214-1671(-)